jgi:hypothetical protein
LVQATQGDPTAGVFALLPSDRVTAPQEPAAAQRLAAFVRQSAAGDLPHNRIVPRYNKD